MKYGKHTYSQIKKWLVCAVKQKLKDIFITNWQLQIDNSSSGILYELIKTKFRFENYLVTLPFKFRKVLRTRNNRLSIETGRWQQIPRDERICFLCKVTIGDDFHFTCSLECKELNDVRKQYLKTYYCKKPNVLKFCQLFNTENRKALFNLINLSGFTQVILSIVS